MQFQVPQFIEVEDKIFGPLTLKQFIYLAGGAGLSAVFYFLLPLFIAALLIIPTVAFVLALAFYTVNSKPFVNVLESAFNYMVKNKLYIWQKTPRAPTSSENSMGAVESVLAPKLSESKLKELAWNLDIAEKERQRLNNIKQ